MSEDKIDLVPLVRQRLMWDMLSEDHEYWDVMNVVPPSRDVAEIQIRESKTRMQMVVPYQQFVEIMSLLSADIITEVMYKNLKLRDGDTLDVDPTWHETTQMQNREIVRGAVFPILAALLSSGMLTAGEAMG